MNVTGRITEYKTGEIGRITLTNLSGDWHFKIPDTARGRIPDIGEFVKIRYNISHFNGHNHKWVQEFQNP